MFMPRRKTLAISLGVLAILGFTGAAQGVVVGFECITQNDARDAAIGEQQLWMDVTSPQGGQAAFTFYNIGTHSSTIAQIYLEQGPLDDLLSIVSSSGVRFHEGASPKSLPGGNEAEPAFLTEFRASADNPAAHKGVNSTLQPDEEWVTLVFGLAEGRSYPDLLQELEAGQFRVGLHVQGFCGGGSEAFISTPPPPVPEPATVCLGIAALLGAGVVRGPRRRLIFTRQ
jgi:hypothetical protein